MFTNHLKKIPDFLRKSYAQLLMEKTVAGAWKETISKKYQSRWALQNTITGEILEKDQAEHVFAEHFGDRAYTDRSKLFPERDAVEDPNEVRESCTHQVPGTSKPEIFQAEFQKQLYPTLKNMVMKSESDLAGRS